LLLALLGNWTDAAMRFIQQEYAQQEREHGGVNEYLSYEAKKNKLANRRTQVNDMYAMRTIDRVEYLARLDAIRKEELALTPPRATGLGIEQTLKAARQIDTLATRWEHLSGDPLMRRKIAHTLIAPGGLVYDALTRRIVGVRPLPDFYEAFKCILVTEGWTERDGAFWHDSYDLVPPPRRRTHYHELVDLLRNSPHAMTAAEIAVAIDCSIANTNLFLVRLFRAGYLLRVAHVNKNVTKYLYRSNGKPFGGEAMSPPHKRGQVAI
jgi:hypothetical protein